MKTLMVLVLFFYFLAMLKFFLHLALQRRFFHVMAVILSAVGFVLHTGLLYAISAKTGHGPYSSPQEYTSFFAWTTTGLMLVFILFFRAATIGAFVAPVAFLLSAFSTLTSDSSAGGQEIREFWLTMHQTLSFLALSSFVIVFAASAMYLIQERQLKIRNIGGLFKRMPDLDTLDLILHRALLFGFPLITVGVASGIIWTYSRFGTLFGQHPIRVVPILFVWAVYGTLMVGRLVGWRGHKIAVMGAAGFGLACLSLGLHLL